MLSLAKKCVRSVRSRHLCCCCKLWSLRRRRRLQIETKHISPTCECPTKRLVGVNDMLLPRRQIRYAVRFSAIALPPPLVVSCMATERKYSTQQSSTQQGNVHHNTTAGVKLAAVTSPAYRHISIQNRKPYWTEIPRAHSCLFVLRDMFDGQLGKHKMLNRGRYARMQGHGIPMLSGSMASLVWSSSIPDRMGRRWLLYK